MLYFWPKSFSLSLPWKFYNNLIFIRFCYRRQPSNIEGIFANQFTFKTYWIPYTLKIIKMIWKICNENSTMYTVSKVELLLLLIIFYSYLKILWKNMVTLPCISKLNSMQFSIFACTTEFVRDAHFLLVTTGDKIDLNPIPCSKILRKFLTKEVVNFST